MVPWTLIPRPTTKVRRSAWSRGNVRAGGIAAGGADEVVVVTTRAGQTQRISVDLVDLFNSGDLARDLTLHASDVVFVNRAPNFYVYGQVQRPGMYSIERGMTVAQAIAKGGGLTLRGTDRGVRVHRRGSAGAPIQVLELRLDEPVRPDDLVFVRESLF